MKLLLIIGLILTFQYVTAQGNIEPCNTNQSVVMEDDSEDLMKELLSYFE